MARKRTRKHKKVNIVQETSSDLLRLSNELLAMVADMLDKQDLLTLRLINPRLNDIVLRSLRSRQIVLYLQPLRSSNQHFNKIVRCPAYANSITTIVYIAKRYDESPKDMSKRIYSPLRKWPRSACRPFLDQYEQDFTRTATSSVAKSLYKAVELLPNLKNITISTQFEPEDFNFEGVGREWDFSIALNRDRRWPLSGEDGDDCSEVDKIWRCWELDSSLDTPNAVFKAIAKHAELHPDKRLTLGLNKCPMQIFNKEVMDFGRFETDSDNIRNAVFVKAASHVKSLVVSLADWEMWKEYVSPRNQSEDTVMHTTRNSDDYGVAWRRMLRQLVNLERFEIKGCAEDRDRIIQFLCGPVSNHVGRFVKLRHLSIEANDYFGFPELEPSEWSTTGHFSTQRLQGFILAHHQTLEKLTLNAACGVEIPARTLSIDERRALLIAIRDQCQALKIIDVREWVELPDTLRGPGDLETDLSWRRRLEAKMPIVELVVEFGAKRVFTETGTDVLEEMSAEREDDDDGEKDAVDPSDEDGEDDEDRIRRWFQYKFDLAALRATRVAE